MLKKIISYALLIATAAAASEVYDFFLHDMTTDQANAVNLVGTMALGGYLAMAALLRTEG